MRHPQSPAYDANRWYTVSMRCRRSTSPGNTAAQMWVIQDRNSRKISPRVERHPKKLRIAGMLCERLTQGVLENDTDTSLLRRKATHP